MPDSTRRHPDAILDAGLFHQAFYQHQRSDRFETEREAFDDFVSHGMPAGLSPHPLFDVGFYVRRNPGVAAAALNPVLHYLFDGWREGRDPHPLFDNDWYLGQLRSTDASCPLMHYLRHAGGDVVSPNPLFDDAFYAREHPDIAHSGVTCLEHYVLHGRTEGRVPAPALRSVVPAWRDASLSLKRGAWRRPDSLWILIGADESHAHGETWRRVQQAHEHQRLDVRVLLAGITAPVTLDAGIKRVSLAEAGVHLNDSPSFRLSSLRMLLFALSGDSHHIDLWQNIDEPRVAEAFTDLGLPVHVVSQPNSFPAGAGGHLGVRAPRPASENVRGRRVVVTCTDWSLSGVHSVAEALGRELMARGWNFSLLFTRGTIGVLDRTTEGQGLPSVPYAFLDTSACTSPRQHWAAIIRALEQEAPCVVLTTFDDLANAVTPALSDQVAVVGWLQSDEDHYYESAYRLGRYWNAMAGVSRRIVDEVVRLNPSFESRAHLIHNSTVRRDEALAPGAPAAGPDLRLVYVGRMVQYQKRVLDLITLVQRLEDRGVMYRLTLIGGFPDAEIEARLRTALAAGLAAGTVRMTGPLKRAQVLGELRAHNVFLMLSDFEGLPVSLIEAMSQGCVPAVAAAASGIPEILAQGENGLVFEHRDYGAWADALDALVRDPARMAALSDQARRTVLERFTVESMTTRFEELFASVLQAIDARTWTRPPTLTWKNPVGDVAVPPSMHGTALD